MRINGLKIILRRLEFVSLLVATVIALSAVAMAQEPLIKVQYPRKNQSLPAVDSTFIIGKVTPGSSLEINGIRVPVHKEGGFLAFLDVSAGEFEFVLTANLAGLSTTLVWPVRIADRYCAVPRDSLAILHQYHVPTVYQELVSGDLLEVSLRGTPGGKASFSIEGVARDIPMVESGLLYENSWGSEVFGSGAVQQESNVAGIYNGSLYIPDSALVDSARIFYKLQVSAKQVAAGRTGPKAAVADSVYSVVEDTAFGRVTVTRHGYPRVVELKDSVQSIRTGPRKGYLSIFQPKGVRFVCIGKYSNYLRLALAPGQTAWVPDTSVILMAQGTPSPQSFIRDLRCTGLVDRVRLQVFLDEKLPFQVEELLDERKFVLRVFYGTSDTDWIRYIRSQEFVKRVTWNQEQDGVYRLVVELEDFNVWGWDSYYEGNTLTLDIIRGPSKLRSYKDLRIMLDPGHSADPGAIGPTGLTEAEANLSIALRLAEMLRKKGATVFVTRVDNSDVKLYDRPKMTREHNCDIFISIHNNSVPDGMNPYYANGTSAYYYNSHSKALAESILARMVDRTDLRDHGLFYANFAVTRPTQYIAVLAECAFMIIPEQEAALRTESFQEKCAKGILEGLDDYLDSLDDD
ncbi:MAG: N-acetylmuramoyl-L-alanine amidase [Candidatus Zixiibacteriota bacterium]